MLNERVSKELISKIGTVFFEDAFKELPLIFKFSLLDILFLGLREQQGKHLD